MATTQTHGVFVNTVGILYASLGFLLSVLAALFGIFYPFINPPPTRSSHARPHLPRKLRRPRIIRSFSDQTRKATMAKPPEHHPVEKACTQDVKSLPRRSKSLIPIITIDHFGSVNSLDFNLLPKPVPNPANTDGAAVNLSTMSRPRIKRQCSSPLIPASPALSVHASDFVTGPIEERVENNKSPSVADLNQETFTMKFDSYFLRYAGKKKSPTLRTQPYGPPHFCTPPPAHS